MPRARKFRDEAELLKLGLSRVTVASIREGSEGQNELIDEISELQIVSAGLRTVQGAIARMRDEVTALQSLVTQLRAHNSALVKRVENLERQRPAKTSNIVKRIEDIERRLG